MPSARRNNARRWALRLAASTSRPAARAAAEPRRVLLLRPDHIGDVLLTAPAVALLRASLPAAHITYVVGPWSVQAARHGPSVDELRSMPYPGFTRRRSSNLLTPYALLAREAARMRAARYDLAVVFRPDHWWGALLALAAGIPTRVGGRTPDTQPLLTHARAAAPGEHAAEQALGLARVALDAYGLAAPRLNGVPMFTPGEAARTDAALLWQQFGFGARRVVALQPSAGAPLKSWPLARWATVVERLTQQGVDVLLVGGPDDAAALEPLRRRVAREHVAMACGQTLAVSAALYARCAVVVGMDGGGAHLAAAMGTPTVRLYGPAPVRVYGPWPPRTDQRVLVADALGCVPCGHLEAPPCGASHLPACMLGIGVDEVLNVVETLLNRG